MRQKGFATIFALCLILVIALIVKGIQEAEANHAREVVNFETEQALQSAAESSIVEAADIVRRNPDMLPYSTAKNSDKVPIPVSPKIFKRGEKEIKITVEVQGERGKIYHYNKDSNNKLKLLHFKIYGEDGTTALVNKTHCDGFYLMSRATIDKGFFGEKIFRRAFAYVIDDAQLAAEFKNTTIHFMELPTEDGDTIKKNS